MQEPEAFRIDFSLIQEGGKTSGKTSGKAGDMGKAATRVKLLIIIKKRPSATISEMAKELGITDQGVAWQINKLKSEGILARRGSSRSGTWQIIG